MMTRLLVSALVWLLVSSTAPLMTGTIAHAAGSDEAAQQAFRTGVDAARQDRWADALVAFEKAYGLSPRPVVLVNLAGAQVRTGHLVEAARNYRRVLNDPPSAETVAFKRAAADVLPSLEARIPHVRLRATGLSPSDLVQIDGQPIAGDLGGDHALDPGEHTVVLQRAGIERARIMFALAERESREISLPLPAPLAAAARATIADAPGSPRAGVPAAGPRSGSARRWWASPWTWILAGAAVAGATVGTIALLGSRGEAFSGNIPPGQISVR